MLTYKQLYHSIINIADNEQTAMFDFACWAIATKRRLVVYLPINQINEGRYTVLCGQLPGDMARELHIDTPIAEVFSFNSLATQLYNIATQVDNSRAETEIDLQQGLATPQKMLPEAFLRQAISTRGEKPLAAILPLALHATKRVSSGLKLSLRLPISEAIEVSSTRGQGLHPSSFKKALTEVAQNLSFLNLRL